MNAKTDPQPLATAWLAGRDAFRQGVDESTNPYSDEAMAHEYTRGYRIARKRARFNATIQKRRTQHDQ